MNALPLGRPLRANVAGAGPTAENAAMATRKRDPFDDVATVARPKIEREAAGPPSFTLTCVAGPNAGGVFSIDGSQPTRVLLGTSPVCWVRLSDNQVSRRHAALELVENGLRLTDLGSTNGTRVSGISCIDVVLNGGEVVQVGETMLQVGRTTSLVTAPLTEALGFGRMVGASPEMRRLYVLCERIAASAVPVILEGETGTGKELLAESLHEMGPRASGPFIVFDCTAIPPNLLESALFGHERGSFTGATDTRRGVFEQAHKGTLLIDEIGDLDLALQSKLLRAIERSEVQRVGGDKWMKVDVRVMAATRRDLDHEVQEGRFRDDLFFRIAVTRIELPPLRKRHGDVVTLARHFWKSLGGAGDLPHDLEVRFAAYEWPGNIRELHNSVARQIALGDLAQIEATRPSMLAPAGAAPGEDFIDLVVAEELPLPRARERVVDEFERRYLEKVLAKHGGNVAKAAESAGIARRYFQIIRARQR